MLSSLLEGMSLKDEDTILFVDVVPNRLAIRFSYMSMYMFFEVKKDSL